VAVAAPNYYNAPAVVRSSYAAPVEIKAAPLSYAAPAVRTEALSYAAPVTKSSYTFTPTQLRSIIPILRYSMRNDNYGTYDMV